ncbi:M48 family metallopeptidase [Erythrobacter rubeus]|uniref:M48 family metallopeptidase n=1 Tax=Erythrobacter rubeus TaxID=2760803 RepID=A0ABR8KQ47_9SPHN|nr:YgjP-like metallopeptidase domain-containing protein [Erythrobacter rubeus]MBD2842800.1 M48 family metallopeptidase [Erythrobacter rubeus]
MIDWLKRAEPAAEAQPYIELGGEAVPIALRRHPTAKRLTLRLAPDGSEVRITMPRWGRSADAIDFAHSRTEWLAQQRAKVPQRREVRDGSTLMIAGETVTLAWDKHAPRRPVLTAGKLYVGGPAEGLASRVQRWLERRALAAFENDVAHYCALADLSPAPVAISRAQRRWGSCSEKSRIRINWRLVQAPDFVRRSVAAHEVAHLVHFDHSPSFHALLADIYEGDISRADRWLKEQGRTLYTSFG